MTIRFAHEELCLDGSGALYWPMQEMLIVSDLHLEKGSFLAQFGAALPQYDSRDTLERLQQLIARYQPRKVVCLGDSFHDCKALQRLSAEDSAQLDAMVTACDQWLWVLGNHDSSMEFCFNGDTAVYEDIGDIRLTHEPDDAAKNQIIGHFHPKLRMRLGGQRLSGKCFLLSDAMLVMPAFGSYTGGLDCEDAALTGLSATPFGRYFLYRGQVWKV